MRKILLSLLIVLITFSLFTLEEGGYVGTYDEGHDAVCYNFLKYFAYEQYYYSRTFQFTTFNNQRVDNMDFAIFAGHGNNWLIATTDGVVDLRFAGNTPHEGYGDTDCEFIAFQSCSVIPSPIEVTNWWWNWVRPGGIFDGLHQALGFRTSSYQATDQNITNEFGKQIKAGGKVWQSWFNAIVKKGLRDGSGKLKEYGSAVMYPTCDQDTYTSHTDPPEDSTWLRIWYQY